MKLISVPGIVFLLISSVTLAQKNRPIVQDAIKIIGYIQKDYSVITDEEQRIETMMQDRNTIYRHKSQRDTTSSVDRRTCHSRE
ncbi:MAG: hypothetical protein AAF149_20425 [Bacteroidota bacterium]